jgi:ABC-2 type transport system permease protein
MINRIIAVMQQEYFITKRSLEVIFDLFIFSSITVVVFGFVAKYLAGSQNTTGAVYLIIGLVLWEIVRVGQYSVTVSVLWNVWSRNLSNMFVSPLSTAEYLAALMISSIIKCAVVLIIVGFIVFYITGFISIKDVHKAPRVITGNPCNISRFKALILNKPSAKSPIGVE